MGVLAGGGYGGGGAGQLEFAEGGPGGGWARVVTGGGRTGVIPSAIGPSVCPSVGGEELLQPAGGFRAVGAGAVEAGFEEDSGGGVGP